MGELSDIYTLNILEDSNVKRISYAASVGSIDIINENFDEFKNKLAILDYISLREKDACDLISKFVSNEKSVKKVLDPTLLLSKKNWDDFINENNAILDFTSDKYIVAYDVAPDIEFVKIANYVSKSTGFKIIYFDKYNSGPVEFVNYIKNAEYVITTSFHATVFSIIFNKKFFVVPHKKTGSRVISLLDSLKIEKRNFKTLDEFKLINYDEEIAWKKVEENLLIERKKSSNWLNDALEDCK